MEPVRKRVDVYHYESGVGEIIARLLNRSNYSAEYLPISRGMPLGKVAEEISERKPDLVFLSLNFGSAMIGASRSQEGLEELVKIREKSQVPVVMVTGGDTTYREEALRRGANGYLLVGQSMPEELITLADKLTGQTQS
ncbi:hypothetical protein HYX06_01390 [Candidatus Woesearchaeota archaeon]|nr:hypothetical protein [Candidatus Woesearchaeota archaeon]